MEPVEVRHPLLKVVLVALAAPCVVENLSCINCWVLDANLTSRGFPLTERTLAYGEVSEDS